MPTLYGLYPNPGSTSFKCTELWIDYDSNATITGYRENRLPSLTSIPQGGYADAVSTAVSARSERRLPDIVGFKAVHGLEYDGCHECSPQVMEAMAKAIPLAPLHNPMFIEVIESVRSVLGPGPFTGAHFETSYGRALPRCARATGIPTPLAEKLGLWRRGFHGNSHLYASERCARLIGLNASLADMVLDEDRILPGTGPCPLLRIESNEELVVAQACTNLLTRAERYTDTLFLQD